MKKQSKIIQDNVYIISITIHTVFFEPVSMAIHIPGKISICRILKKLASSTGTNK
jgi:hypothetical protein